MRVFKQQIISEDDKESSPWRNKVIIKRALIFIGVLSALGVFAVVIVYPKFIEFRRNRLLRSANGFLEAQDLRSAYFLLEQLITEDSGNLAARRLFARVLDQYGSGQGLIEWESLTKAEPGNAENYIGLAGAALRAGRLDELSQALAALQKLRPDSIEYHRLAAALAMSRGDATALRQAVEALARVDPGNETTQFNLAGLRLRSPDPAEVTAARETLENFARGDRLRIRATLVLIDDLAQRWPEERDPARRQALLAQRLKAADPRLRTVGSFMLTGAVGQRQPGFQDLVEHMKNQPAPSPEDAASLARWMTSIGQNREALVWLEGLDDKILQSPTALGAMATCALGLGSWPKLEQLLLRGAWGPVTADTIKYAFQSHNLRSAGNASKAESLWDKAVQVSGQSQADLHMLYRLAQVWLWSDKQGQILWLLVRRYPGDVVAWNKLTERAFSTRDTVQVWRVYDAWARAAPDNIQARMERVILGLLTRPQAPGLMDQADELYRSLPDNAGVRLAQALALWRRGRTGEALALLEPDAATRANEPRYALVRGLLLASAGRHDESDKLLALVPMEVLLPEEIALIKAAGDRSQ